MAILPRNEILDSWPLFEKRVMKGGNIHFRISKPILRLVCLTDISLAWKPYDNFCILTFQRNKISKFSIYLSQARAENYLNLAEEL